MVLYLHRNRRHWVKSVCWQGRAVRVHLLTRRADGMPVHNISFIFVHMAHGEEQGITLADVAYLIRTRPRGSKVTVLGDINVDQLPACSADPFDMLPNRDHHHIIERMRLDNFCEGFNLEVPLPEMTVGSPGGPVTNHPHSSGIANAVMHSKPP